MRYIIFIFLLAPLYLTPATAAQTSGQMEMSGGGVTVHDAWAQASAGAATTGAAYVTLTGGEKPDALVGVSTPVAATAEVHQSFSQGGMMRMRGIGSLRIKPGAMVTFEPGGYHIMLMDLKQPLVAGESFPLTLTFAHQAPLTFDVQVRPIGAAAAMGGHDHMNMKMQ